MHRLLKTIEKVIADNSPAILTTIGVSGTVTTAFLASKASFVAFEMIQDDEGKGGTAAEPMQRFKERSRLVWKLYIPAVATGALSIACIIGANRIGNRRAAAIAAAYSISDKAFSEYREQVVEKIGANKERAVRDELAQSQVAKNPSTDQEVIITGNGEVLCYESYTGRYFNCNIETLRKAQNTVNFTLINDGYVSLTDFYSEIGLPSTSASDEIGWRNDNLLDLKFSTTLSEDGRPCISINYQVEPIRDYYRTK